jgi:hypothetical protein
MTSPDGRYTVDLVDGGEYRMGGPIIGKIAVSTGYVFENCGQAMIFAADSRHLAVAIWKEQELPEGVRLVQSILVIDPETGDSVRWPGEFGELQFRDFEHGAIHALESPKGDAREFHIAARLP